MVTFSEDEFKGIPKRSLVIVHNHPRSESFSPEDMNFLVQVQEVKAIVAAGHNGDIYTLSTENTKMIDDDIFLEYNKLKEVYSGDLHKVVSELAKRYEWRYVRK